MSDPLRIRRVRVYQLAIPMRVRFEHAAAKRDTADPVVVRLEAEAPYNQLVGHGETLARSYVTGETAGTVVDDLCEILIPHLLEFRPQSFFEALEFLDQLPAIVEGRSLNAARAALELALIDLAGQAFRHRAADVAKWLDAVAFGPPGCLERVRYSGIIIGRTPRKAARWVRLQRCYGLRDFKIKVAIEGWQTKLEAAGRVLRGAIADERATLRADANGGWSFEQAVEAAPILEHCGVTALEQPLRPEDDTRLPELAQHIGCDLIADESLLSIEDAKRLLRAGGVSVFNIRIAKVGGLLAALRIAEDVLGAGQHVQLGCLVGETSILSAAGLAFLEACPRVRFVEGAFGPLLLANDVCRRPIRFRFGGRVRPARGYGLGITVSEAALERLSHKPAIVVNL